VTLVELLLVIGLIVIIFGGVSLSFSSVLDSITNTELRAGAASVIGRQVEIIRNLPYEDVGVVGGVPAGTIPAQQSSTWDNVQFILTTTIRNIDDPYDGVIGGVPSDTAPADYKLVEIEASCPTCNRFVPLRFTTTVAPKNLESATTDGSLFVSAIDASGQPVSGAMVSVVNASVTPSINLTDTTNNQGMLQLVGVPTSTQRYEIAVSGAGYTSDRTYLPGDPQNPNPASPHATVSQGTLTQATFSIDRASTINVRTSDIACAPQANKNFTISGTKLIGTAPDVLKFSTSSATDGAGVRTLNGIEWDTYTLVLNEGAFDVLGTSPISPLTINPSSTADFRFVIQPADPRSLLVTVKDSATGGPVPDASVTLSKAGYSETLTTGRGFLVHTDWSGNQYSSEDGNVAVGSPPGSLTLVGPPYPTSTEAWLISNTFDVGSSSSTFYSLRFNPASQPAFASARFQIAANNDQATWNFVGPDGTAGTYYTASGDATPGSLDGNRYLRYKAYLSTQDGNITPQIDDVRVEFRSVCVPETQVLFTALDLDTYSLDATAPGYGLATSTVSVTGDWQQATILLQ